MDALEARRLKSDIAAARFQLALIRMNLWERKYRSDQPRVPAGSSEGGQWTDDAGGFGGLPPGDEAYQLDDGVYRPEGDDRPQLEPVSAPRPPRVNLDEEEKQGGHAAKHGHIGTPNAALMRMLSEERLDMPAVSVLAPAHGAFNDLATANAYTNDVLQASPAQVEAVARGEVRSAELIRRYATPTGREAYRATKGMNGAILIRPTFSVFVKIKHTGTGKGFVVTTAYPRNKDSDY